MTARLYFWQRLTALIMVPLIIVHLATIVYAIGGGLSASEILARTQGSIAWGLFYGAFVAAASVHAAIGVRTILLEWLGLKGTARELIALTLGVLLLGLGARAVMAVVL